MLESINLGEFNSHVLQGRPKAGLATLVKPFIKSEFISLLQGHGSFLAIKLFINKRQFIIINTYLPPDPDSSNRTLQWEQFADYIGHLERNHPQAHFLIEANLTARVGANNETIYNILEGENDPQPPDYCALPRTSKDKCLNVADLTLTRLSLQYNLMWLNGLYKFRNASEFTFISPIGCSVIDYILISVPLYSRVVDFEIVDFKLTDHLPLSLKLDLEIARSTISTIKEDNNQFFPKFIWKETSLSKIHLLLEESKAIEL